jgi:predicted RNA-binding protein with PIN domain
VHLIVDGMNVIGSEPNGWWRDRGGARRRLVEDLARLAHQGTEVVVVFDGRPTAGEDGEGAGAAVHVAFAPGGPNAADDAIVDMVSRLPRPEDSTVVTSDRALVERVRRWGAKVESAGSFRRRLGNS